MNDNAFALDEFKQKAEILKNSKWRNEKTQNNETEYNLYLTDYKSNFLKQ